VHGTYDEAVRLVRRGDPMLLERTIASGGPREGLEPVAMLLLARTGAVPDGWLASSGLVEDFTQTATYYGSRGFTERRVKGIRSPKRGDPRTLTTLRYSDVVAGRVGPEVLRDAIVFVGSTDLFPTKDPDDPARDGLSTLYFHALAAQRVLQAVSASRQ